MQSPVHSGRNLEVPRTVERRRKGRGVDVMSYPTPERGHLPTPVTERRTLKRTFDDVIADKAAVEGAQSISVHPPTPQTLPRKRTSPGTNGAAPYSPPSPSGHTTFFLSHGSTAEIEVVSDMAPPRRRPGLLFAQQMGLTTDPSTTSVKFGARLGVGVGMGGGLRGSTHGPVDKMSLDNPFLEDGSAAAGSSRSVSGKRRQAAGSPGRETSYVPQAVRPDAERSMSPLMRDRHRGGPLRMLTETLPESSRAAKRKAMMDEDNPFMAKPGEIHRPKPLNTEKGPFVTYVFRGAKRTFANPFVPPNAPYPAADLDVSDVDYDPHPCPPPKLLWPTSNPETSPASSSVAPASTPRRRVLSERMDVDSDDDEQMPVRRGLLFGATPGQEEQEQSDGSEGSARKRPRFNFGSN